MNYKTLHRSIASKYKGGLKLFRIYDRKTKKMVKNKDILLSDDTKGNFTPLDCTLYDEEGNPESFINEQRFSIELFSGLSDIKGNPIYENDIVETLAKNIYRVEFLEGAFYLIGLNNKNVRLLSNLNKKCIITSIK